MPEPDNAYMKSRREEIRGLFTLGILAILLGFRISNYKLVVPYGSTQWDLTWLVDFTIVLWVFYGICMIFAFSDDLFSEGLTQLMRHIGETFMSFSLATFIIVALIFSAYLHPNRTDLFMSLLIYTIFGILGLGLFKSIKNFMKSEISLYIRLQNRINIIRKNISNLAFAIVIIDLILISYLPPSFDKYMNILSMIGFSSLVLFLGFNLITIVSENKS